VQYPIGGCSSNAESESWKSLPHHDLHYLGTLKGSAHSACDGDIDSRSLPTLRASVSCPSVTSDSQ
jgi:hypothetical protein